MEILNRIKNIQVFENIDLSRYTTIKLGQTGDIIICKTEKALKETIGEIKKSKLKYHLVGWGSNQILLNTKNTVFIKLDFEIESKSFKEIKNEYFFPASTSLMRLSSMAAKLGLSGWEVFTGVPASLGGAIYMNAGTALGEIGQFVKSVRILNPSGEVYEHICCEDSFAYRANNFIKDGEIILGATLTYKEIDSSIGDQIKNYLEYRKKTQPLTTKNCGSVFKNFNEYYKAGIIIDKTGLKGFGTEELRVSQMHGNFIENSGEASSEDFKALTDKIKLELERQSGVKFELEAKIY